MLDHETAATNSSSDEGSFKRDKKLPDLTQANRGKTTDLTRATVSSLHAKSDKIFKQRYRYYSTKKKPHPILS